MATGAEPVRAPGWELFVRWQALIDAEDPRFVLIGKAREVAGPLADIADSIRVSMWNMQRHHTIRTLRVNAEHDAKLLWVTTDRQQVADAVTFFDTVWTSAEPAVPEGEEPPYTVRMVEIALHLVDGSTDREIARSLGVSERTVSSDVREMSRRLGARSRTHAIALISRVEG